MKDFDEQPDLLTPHFNQRISLPNATATLTLGILSIIFSLCYGIVGIILGVIGLVLANRDMAEYRMAPHQYFPGSYSNSNAGKVCAIIGIALGSIFFIGFLLNQLDWYRTM